MMAPGLRPLLKDACKRPQLPGRNVRLLSRLRLQAEGRSLVFTSRDLGQLLKSSPNHVAHLSALKSAPVSGASPT